jgi:AcrR family transcriptional regulator
MARKSIDKTSLPRPGRSSAPSARQRILDAAIPLFYQQGARAVGIDTVIAKSGVAKMSLYRSFRSRTS